jgi:hypothetical protein
MESGRGKCLLLNMALNGMLHKYNLINDPGGKSTFATGWGMSEEAS